MELGPRIKALRESAGLTQVEFAKILKISNTTLSQYESGTRVPGDEIKGAIADHFGVTLDYLYGRTDQKNIPTQGGKRVVQEEEVRAAFFGGADDLTEEEMDAMWHDAKDYIQYKLEQRRKLKHG